MITTDPFALPQCVRPHPGEHLREDYLVPLGMSASELARQLKVPANRITAILNEQRSITADSAWRLARFWGTTADFWMNLQKSHDLSKAWLENGKKIEREVNPRRREDEAA
ncbi:MAG: HigA family addiction module antitoxin [Erythrobacter sp.]